MPYRAFRNFLHKSKVEDRLRQLRTVGPSHGGQIQINHRSYLNFSSNNYLNLAEDKRLLKRALEWGEIWGMSSSASRLVCGDLAPFTQIEQRLCQEKGGEAALVFNSGFQANSGLLTALLDRQILGCEPLVFSDRLNHASIHHGCRAAHVRQIRYHHLDLNHLESLLKKHEQSLRPKYILSETIFSMDGDRADIKGLIELKKRFNAFLYLDEAHATGVFGPRGFGLAAAYPGEVDLVMGTFGKALGSFGAYVLCRKVVRDYLINRCAAFIYATALPPPVLGAIDAALEIIPTLDAERKQLLDHARYLRDTLKSWSIDVGYSESQIIPAILGEEEKTLAFADALRHKHQILAVAIRPPTVPKGGSRLRFSVTAGHDRKDMDALLTAIETELGGILR
ncbi:aminotransferase class I/II-fold pyridoxal phosphate-dependent enzyme [Magnetococcales bacterium HHB-1]